MTLNSTPFRTYRSDQALRTLRRCLVPILGHSPSFVLFSALLYEITDPFLGLSVRERIQHLVNVTKDIIDMRLIGLMRCPLLFLGLLLLLGSLLFLNLTGHLASRLSSFYSRSMTLAAGTAVRTQGTICMVTASAVVDAYTLFGVQMEKAGIPIGIDGVHYSALCWRVTLRLRLRGLVSAMAISPAS